MNFSQALILLKQGHTMRRDMWRAECHISFDNHGHIIDEDGDYFNINDEALIADDWQSVTTIHQDAAELRNLSEQGTASTVSARHTTLYIHQTADGAIYTVGQPLTSDNFHDAYIVRPRHGQEFRDTVADIASEQMRNTVRFIKTDGDSFPQRVRVTISIDEQVNE